MGGRSLRSGGVVAGIGILTHHTEDSKTAAGNVCLKTCKLILASDLSVWLLSIITSADFLVVV
jgi:hypothetical protein